MRNDLEDALAVIWMVGDGRGKDAESQFGKGSTLHWPAPLNGVNLAQERRTGGGGGYAGHGKVWGTVR